MSAVGDARKRLADLARASGGADAQAAALAPPGSPGLAGYFVAGNADGDPIIWRDDNCPEPVNGIEGWKVRRDHPGLWDAIVALIEGSAPVILYWTICAICLAAIGYAITREARR